MRTHILLLALLTAGCASEPTLEPQAEPETPVPAPVVVETSAATETLPAKTLAFDAPEGWVSEKPKNNMRKAQYVLPRAEGDPADAEMVVFWFGGGGGSVDANVDRWAGQFEQEDGGSTRERTQVEERDVNGMKTTFIDMGGRYVAGHGAEEEEDGEQPAYRMLAAIIESPHGNYYLKLMGPQATVEKWAASFDAFVGSAREQ